MEGLASLGAAAVTNVKTHLKKNNVYSKTKEDVEGEEPKDAKRSQPAFSYHRRSGTWYVRWQPVI